MSAKIPSWLARWREAFARPAAATLLMMGFASGLPFLLVGGTLSVWLRDEGISLEDIGLISLASLAYAFKFVWAPAVDRYRLPILGCLGRRRSWLLLAQGVLALALVSMALLTPSTHLGVFVLIVVIAGFSGATQDVVVDAYRIECAPPEFQGALAATYTLGYRLALLVSGALALTLADHLPWTQVYLLMAALVVLVMTVTVFAREPEPAAPLPQEPLLATVAAPFREFFQRFAGRLGLALLCFIGAFKISDQMLGVMAFPFYLDSGFTKTEIAAVSKLFGVWISIAGAFLGGAVAVTWGAHRTLWIALVVGAASNLLFVLLAAFPGDLAVFVAVIGGENLAGGFLGAAAVAWLSSLVNQAYTASQYALFSSLVALPGKLIGGFSGFMVGAWGYVGFFLFSAAAVIPALFLLIWLSPRLKARGLA